MLKYGGACAAEGVDESAARVAEQGERHLRAKAPGYELVPKGTAGVPGAA